MQELIEELERKQEIKDNLYADINELIRLVRELQYLYEDNNLYDLEIYYKVLKARIEKVPETLMRI